MNKIRKILALADMLFAEPDLRLYAAASWKWLVCALVAAGILHHCVEPEAADVRQVFELVQDFGLKILLCVVIAASFIRAFLLGHLPSPIGLFNRMLDGLLFYSIALWLIGNVGDTAYEMVLLNPSGAAITATAIIIIWLIVDFSRLLGPVSIFGGSNNSAVMSRRVAANSLPQQLTERDNRYTAAHEAGHMLVYAALGCLPPDAMAAINEHQDHRGVLGFTRGSASQHCLDERRFAEWYMLVFLAGKMGESSIMGESTLGSGEDHFRWIETARKYLSNHYEGVFYATPENLFQERLNEEKLLVLQNRQRDLLKRLFEQNAGVFMELADALFEKRKLARADLIPFLSRVVLPEGFPLPFGEFGEFSAKWFDSE